MRKTYLLLALLASNLTQAQFTEDFESGFPPAGWAIFDNGISTGTSWDLTGFSNSGSGAAFIDYDCSVPGTSEDWLVTPLISVNPGDFLTFYHLDPDTDDYGSSYEIRVSTLSQTNPSDFTTIQAYTESMVPDVYTQVGVNLSAYVGMNVYIAFVQVQDCGDAWFIDDIAVGAPPCLNPNDLSVTGMTSTSVDLTWTAATASMWDVSVVPDPMGPGTYTTVLTNSHTENSLTSGASYIAYVREVCTNSSPLMLTGIIDGPLSGGTPKAIELYVVEDIADLSIFGVSSANNGGGTTGIPEYNFPSMSVTAGTYLYVTTDSANFNNFMGFNADFIEGSASNINGDDAIELYMNGIVVDVFGDVDVDGTGQPWEYLDGWVYRNSGTLSNDGIFVVSDWTYSGINAQDGEVTNASSAIPWPNATFTTTPDKSDWISLKFCPGVMGDNSTVAIAVASLPYSDTSATNQCYSNQMFYPSADVFYKLIIDDPCIKEISIDLCGSDPSFDTYLWILDNQLNYLMDNDDDCGLQSGILNFPVALDDTLYIIVEGLGTEEGDYILHIEPIYYDSLALIDQQDLVCSGDTDGSATVDNGDIDFTFEWDDVSMQTGTTATNLAAGTYTVTATNSVGCVYTHDVIITSPPAISLSATTTPEVSGNDGAIDLTVSGGTPPYTYAWTNGAGTNEDPTALAGNITYTVTVTDANGCSENLDVLVSNAAGISSNKAGSFRVFPNPNFGQFTLELPGNVSENTPVQVFDAAGQLVYEFTASPGTSSVNLNSLATGTYVLRMISESVTFETRFTIMN